MEKKRNSFSGKGQEPAKGIMKKQESRLIPILKELEGEDVILMVEFGEREQDGKEA